MRNADAVFRRHSGFRRTVVLLLTGSLLAAACTAAEDSTIAIDEGAQAAWFEPIISGFDGVITDYCEHAACIAGTVLLPSRRALLAVEDLEMPDTLGALSLSRTWIGEGAGLFGDGWHSIWDITLDGGTLFGPLPGRPLEAPGVGRPIPLSDGSTITLDDQGRVIEVCESEAICTIAQWSDEAVTLSPTRTTQERIELRLRDGLVVEASTSDGRSVRYTYSEGRLTTVASPAGEETYLYSEEGHLIEHQGLTGRCEFSFDEGQVTTMTDRFGGIWRLGDIDDRTIEVARPDGVRRTYRFDETRLIEAVDSQLGVVIRREYDGGVLRREERPLDHTVIRMLDSGRVRYVQRPLDGAPVVATFTYDARGRIIETESASGKVTYVYHGASISPRAVESLTGTFTYDYDEDGLVIAATDADGYRVHIERGANGLPISVVDDLTEMKFEYDPAGRIISQSSGDHTELARFDALGRLRSTTTASGRETRYDYDTLGRLSQVDGARSTTLTYAPEGWLDDSSSGLLGVTTDVERAVPTGTPWQENSDRTFTRRDSTGVVTTTDRWGRIVRVESDGRATQREFDEAGRMTRLTGPDGVIDVDYTAAGRVARVKVDGVEIALEWAGELMTSLAVSTGTRYDFTYDRSGRLIATVQGAMRWDYHYDLDGQVTRVATPVGVLSYLWDETGRPASTTLPSGAQRSYTWDPDGEITTVTDTDGTVLRIDRNAAGLVEAVRSGDSVTRIDYDAAARVIGYRTDDGPRVAVSYGAGGVSGLAIGETTELWSYSADGRIDSVTRGQERFELDWAAPGLLRSVTRDGTVLAAATYDPRGRVTEVRNETGETSALFDWSSFGISAMTIEGDTLDITRDAEGRLTGIVDGDEAAAQIGYVAGVLRTLSVDGRTVDHRFAEGRLARTQVTTSEGEVSVLWSADGAVPTGFEGSFGTGNFEYDASGRLDAVTVDGTRTPLTIDERGRFDVGGRTGDLLADLFTVEGRFASNSQIAAGPVLPLLSLLPEELDIALPTPITPDEIVQVAVAGVIPQLPRPLVPPSASGWADAIIDTSLGIGAQVAVPVGPAQFTQLSLRPGAVDLAAVLAGSSSIRVAESVREHFGPGPCLLCRVADFGAGALRTIGSGAASLFGFVVNNPVTSAIATFAFIGVAAVSAVVCTNALCQAGTLVGTVMVAQLLAGGDVGFLRGLFDTVAAPVRSVITGLATLDALAIAAGAAVIAGTVATRRIYNGTPVQSRVIQKACRFNRVPCLSYSQYPGAASNYLAAQSAGVGRISRVNRVGIAERRQGALAGIPTRAGFDRDEAPPALLRANNRRVAVSYVLASDNRGAGATLGRQLAPVRNGRLVFPLIVP